MARQGERGKGKGKRQTERGGGGMEGAREEGRERARELSFSCFIRQSCLLRTCPRPKTAQTTPCQGRGPTENSYNERSATLVLNTALEYNEEFLSIGGYGCQKLP